MHSIRDICLSENNTFVPQEVVEKNLRHARDTKKRKEDAESVDDSNMSTSSNLEAFANDDLGIFLHIYII